MHVMHHTDHPHLRWDLMTLTEIPKHIKCILNGPANGYLRTYPRASAGLQWILDGTERLHEHEPACDEYTDWLHEHGPTYALRPPSETERARAAGVAEYFAALGLTGRRLTDVVRLSFDGRALQRRLWPLLRDWDAGQHVHAPPPVRPPPTLSGSTEALICSFSNAHHSPRANHTPSPRTSRNDG